MYVKRKVDDRLCFQVLSKPSANVDEIKLQDETYKRVRSTKFYLLLGGGGHFGVHDRRHHLLLFVLGAQGGLDSGNICDFVWLCRCPIHCGRRRAIACHGCGQRVLRLGDGRACLQHH